jgi:hypothetical protein
MKKNMFFIICMAISLALFLLSATSIEARHCRSRFGINFNVVQPTPQPQVVTYYQAPVYYPAPVYYTPAPHVIYQPVQVVRHTQRVYYPQQSTSFSFGWYR